MNRPLRNSSARKRSRRLERQNAYYHEVVADKEKAKRDAIRERALLENDGHLYPQRECEYCGTSFWPAGPNTKTCSEECSHAHGIQKMREWRDAQKEILEPEISGAAV